MGGQNRRSEIYLKGPLKLHGSKPKMNMFSQVLIGLLMVLVDNAAVIKDESQCTAKVVGSLCKSHADCYCPNTYILCNHEKRCENASLALISILLPLYFSIS
ncbi:hypothetical protein AC249_AIPGENE17047 [Exaiptasia diaphana]|nr:hypothetical protein AC249_AIPGENE17047 [Exaiptasia diaphana]